MTHRQRLLIAGLIVPVTLILDQVTKYLVLQEPRFNALDCLDYPISCGRIEVMPGLFDLQMVWNRGFSFGTLQSEGIMRWVLVGVTLLITIGFVIWLFRAATRLTVIALAFVVAGAIGNIIDRIRFGAVVDFIDAIGGYFPWVFNVADSAVTVGAVLLLFDQFILSQEDAKTKSARGTGANTDV